MTSTGFTTTMPLDTPIGRLVLEADADVLIGVWLPHERRHGRRDADDVPTVLKETATQLDEYFAGERTDFDLRTELDGTPDVTLTTAPLSPAATPGEETTQPYKVVGIRLFGVRPDTLLGTLGMENGDRLEKINGFDMTSPESALEAYARLRTADKLTVSLNRRGQETNVDYNIK